jgi:hypothetical protein
MHIEQSQEGQSEGPAQRTIVSVLSKGFDGDIDDLNYLLNEAEEGNVSKADLPLVARTCAVIIRREKQAGQDVTAYEKKLPRNALEDWWTTRLQGDPTKIATLLTSGNLNDAYQNMISFFDSLPHAAEDGFDTANIKDDFKQVVSGPLLRTFIATLQSPTLDSISTLIATYELAHEHEELFDHIGSSKIGKLKALEAKLESN